MNALAWFTYVYCYKVRRPGSRPVSVRTEELAGSALDWVIDTIEGE